jgi:TRAP-type C4-dicarboxylate transport system substrate-binding protein
MPADLQAAILQAGKDAGTYGRILESSEDIQKLMQMQSEGKLKTIYFKEREALVKAAEPVIKAYFEENKAASNVLQNIQNAQ